MSSTESTTDLAAGLAWLDTHINFESDAGGPPRAGSTGGLSLDRMAALCEVLGDPQRAYPVIHLTGTNGKGSTARIITDLLAASGLTVGTYTSPHLDRVNERISRNGEPIADEELARVLADLRSLSLLSGVENSYFELLTAAAYRWFADVAVDVAVVEVGMLGTFDATNVADGSVAVVTNIGRDHAEITEGWRQRVAQEKAGIIKAGATLILGETDPDLSPIFYRAGADEVWERDRDYGVERNDVAIGGRLVDIRTPSGLYPELYLALNGAHQADNAACALAAVEAFFAAPVPPEVVEEAFAAVTMPGRFEVLGRHPLVIFDGAHNPDGAAAASTTLFDDFEVVGARTLVIGLLAPKEPTEMLEAFEADRFDLVVCTQPDSLRAVPAAEVAAAAEAMGAAVLVDTDARRAMNRALRLATEDDVVLVAGSLYLGATARSVVGSRPAGSA